MCGESQRNKKEKPMSSFSELRLKDRLFMKAYRYRSYDWEEAHTLEKPLSESRLAVVTTAALYRPDQEPFDESFRGGDYSYRELPVDTELDGLRMGHRSASFDHRPVEEDKNVALPLDRLRELVEEGFVGELNHRHLSFMGSVTAPGRLMADTAPEAAALLKQDQVDAVLLTPV